MKLSAEQVLCSQPDADSTPRIFGAASKPHSVGRPLMSVPSLPSAQCDGSMTCECKLCEAEREHRVRSGIRASQQPWHVREAA